MGAGREPPAALVAASVPFRYRAKTVELTETTRCTETLTAKACAVSP